jgi:hypothetical protein
MQLQLPAKITQRSVQAFINKLRLDRDYRRRNCLDRAMRNNLFPDANDIGYRKAIEAQVPLVTVNDDGSFSAPGLTAWYVSKFSDINNLVL